MMAGVVLAGVACLHARVFAGAEKSDLFADAEGAEDDAEEVFGIGAAGDFTEGVECLADIDGCEFGVWFR